MIRLAFLLTARLHGWLQDHAPSNRLVRRVRSTPYLQWTPICLGLGLACFVAVDGLVLVVRRGAPGVLNFVILVLIYDMMKLLFLAFATPAWWFKARVTRRRTRYMSYSPILNDIPVE